MLRFLLSQVRVAIYSFAIRQLDISSSCCESITLNACVCAKPQLETQPSVLSHSLGELGIGTYLPNVMTCQMETPLANVLRLQYQRNVTATPVIDQSGWFLSSLNAALV
jgi:hypothetical protein